MSCSDDICTLEKHLGRELTVFQERSAPSYEELYEIHYKDLARLKEFGPEICVKYMRFILSKPDRNMRSFVQEVIYGGKNTGEWLRSMKD